MFCDVALLQCCFLNWFLSMTIRLLHLVDLIVFYGDFQPIWDSPMISEKFWNSLMTINKTASQITDLHLRFLVISTNENGFWEKRERGPKKILSFSVENDSFEGPRAELKLRVLYHSPTCQEWG